MRLLVLRPIKLKKAGRLFDIAPEAVVEIAKPEKARVLIESGHIRPLLPPDEAGKLQAARIFLKVIGCEIWVVTHPDALPLVPVGAVVYLPEEIKNLRGASPEDIQAVHRVKCGLGGCLISVMDRRRNDE